MMELGIVDERDFDMSNGRKTDRELLNDWYTAHTDGEVMSAGTEIAKRFRDLLDRVDTVNDRSELHQIDGTWDRFEKGYATACQHCKEDLSDERSNQ